MDSQVFNLGALKGLKVIDASRVLGGPIAGQILGDHGAEVIKVESPNGDDTRRWGPPYLGSQAAYFSGLNRNKTSIEIDLSTTEGKQKFLEQLSSADILIENFKESTLKKWGWGINDFTALYPHLIHCRVSGFGSKGPYKGLPAYDTAMQGLCGLMSVNGHHEEDSLRVGLPVVDMTTGLNAVIGVLLALNHKLKTGEGQFVETSLYANAISLLHPHAPNYFATNQCPRPSGNAHPNIYPYDSFATKNGAIYLAVGNDKQFKIFCEHVGLSELITNPLFISNEQRSIHRLALKELIQNELVNFDSHSLFNTLIKSGVPCSPIQSVEQALNDPHTIENQLIVELGNGYKGLASPIDLSKTPASYRLTPPDQANTYMKSINKGK